MGMIKVNIDAVMNQHQAISNVSHTLSDVKASLDGLYRQIDPKILSRNNIGSRVRSTSIRLNNIQNKVIRIQNVIETGVCSYYSADINARHKVQDIFRNL